MATLICHFATQTLILWDSPTSLPHQLQIKTTLAIPENGQQMRPVQAEGIFSSKLPQLSWVGDTNQVHPQVLPAIHLFDCFFIDGEIPEAQLT